MNSTNSQLAQIDLLGQNSNRFTKVDFKSIEDGIELFSAKFILALHEALTPNTSSGKLKDSIAAQPLQVNGSVYSVNIEAAAYVDFLDQGVNGWANQRGSKFSFKASKRGGGGSISGLTPMQKSIKEYLQRENKINTNTKVAVTRREKKRANMPSAEDQQAKSVSFMIRRMGIKPTLFWQKATNKVTPEFELILGNALKFTIINSFK